jgi:hypothetical protein
LESALDLNLLLRLNLFTFASAADLDADGREDEDDDGSSGCGHDQVDQPVVGNLTRFFVKLLINLKLCFGLLIVNFEHETLNGNL